MRRAHPPVSPRRALLLAGLVLVLPACASRNVARDRALAAADQARARGDVVGEALALREACAAAPRDAAVCGRATRVRDQALAITRDAAEAACAIADASAPALDGCLAALAPLRALDPADLTAGRLADAAGRIHAARCGRGGEDVSTALRQARCAEAKQAAIATAGYAAWVTARRHDAAGRLLEVAAARDVVERAGAQAALLGAARCLAPSDELARRATAAHAAFVAGARHALVVRVRGDVTGELCGAVAAALGERVACGPEVEGAVVLDADVTLDAVRHAAWEDVRTQRYLAGVERRDNPAYYVRADDEQRSREAMRDSERRWQRDQEECEAAEAAYTRASCTACPEQDERDRVCAHAETSEELFRQRERDWQRARADLDATPAVLEHEDWRDATYTVVHHQWTAGWSAIVTGPDGAHARVAGSTSIGDEAHDGSRAAGVGPDPLTEPRDGWQLGAVQAQLVDELVRLASDELGRRVQALRAWCPADAPAWTGEWLDCWATSTLWAGASVAGDALLAVEAAADDRRTGEALAGVTCW